MGLTHLILILHRAGFSCVSHQRTVFANYGLTDTMKEVMYSDDF